MGVQTLPARTRLESEQIAWRGFALLLAPPQSGGAQQDPGIVTGQVLVAERESAAIRANQEREPTPTTRILPDRLPGEGVPVVVGQCELERFRPNPQHQSVRPLRDLDIAVVVVVV